MITLQKVEEHLHLYIFGHSHDRKIVDVANPRGDVCTKLNQEQAKELIAWADETMEIFRKIDSWGKS